MTKNIIKLCATVFNLGYFPIPGTMGSLAGLLIYFLLKTNSVLYLIILAMLLVLGFYVSGKTEEILKQKDSAKIIMDEVCGMLIALFLLPARMPVVISAFFIFRALDTIKPIPIDKLQHLSGSKGIMLDDIVAGVYTNLIIQASLRLTSILAS